MLLYCQELSGDIIVKVISEQEHVKKGKSVADAMRLHGNAMAAIKNHKVKKVNWDTGMYVIDLQGKSENVVIPQIRNSALSLESIEYVEPDWTVYPVATCTDDTRLNEQWHHNANRMQSCDAWDLHTGNPSAVTVAICDTGIQTNHPDLDENRLPGYNAVDGTRCWEGQGNVPCQIGAVHP